MGPLVLVAEDFDDYRTLFRDYLAGNGFRVEVAVNGLDAVRKARELMPDVIVMDLAMPEMDGFEASAALRADARTEQIPVIAMSGDPRAVERSKTAAFESVMRKPCSPTSLLEAIRNALRSALHVA